MKTKINGVEVECSVEEFRQLTEKEEKPMFFKREIDTTTRRGKHGNQGIKYDYDDIFSKAESFMAQDIAMTESLRRAFDYEKRSSVGGVRVKKFKDWLAEKEQAKQFATELKEKIDTPNPKRTWKQRTYDWSKIFDEAYNLISTETLSPLKALEKSAGKSNLGWKLIDFKKFVKKQESRKTDKRIPVGREKLTLAHNLHREKGMPISDAIKEAGYMLRNKATVPMGDYASQCISKATDKIVTSFPIFTTVDTQFTGILKNIIETTIKMKGELKFEQDGFAVGIEEFPIWKEFMLEIVRKSEQITKYFNVSGRFVMDYKQVKYIG